MSLQPISPAETLADTVARRVRGLMGESRVSGLVLANMLGMTQQALSRRTTGATPFKLEELPALAQALGVSEAYLLGFTDDRGASRADTGRYLARALDAEVIPLAPFLARRASIARPTDEAENDAPARVIRFAPVAAVRRAS